MALRIPRGIDPSERWEIDFAAEKARAALEGIEETSKYLRAKADREKDAKEKASIEEALAVGARTAEALRADLAGYLAGSGPVFFVGHIPNGKRAEIQGDAVEVSKLPAGKERVIRDRAWEENVVRWAVKGHAGLVFTSGKTIEFSTEEAEFAGQKVAVVSRATLEAYGACDIIGDLAGLIMRGQRLDETRKNG